MTVVACIEAAGLVLVVLAFLHYIRARDAAQVLALRETRIAISTAEQAWADERRELLNRIQRPEIVQLPRVEGFITPEPEPDGWGLVGTVAEPEETE